MLLIEESITILILSAEALKHEGATVHRHACEMLLPTSKKLAASHNVSRGDGQHIVEVNLVQYTVHQLTHYNTLL